MTGQGASSMTFWWRRCTSSRAHPVYGIALAVGEYLQLDVARPDNGFSRISSPQPNADSASAGQLDGVR